MGEIRRAYLPDIWEVEVVLDEHHWPGDNPGVISEQEATYAGEKRQQKQEQPLVHADINTHSIQILFAIFNKTEF